MKGTGPTAWLLLAGAIATPARGACTFETQAADLDAALAAAEQAYATLDAGEFERAMAEVDFVVPCLVEPVTPASAARLHRVRGLGRYAEGDREGATASLSAARTLEPDHSFSTDMLPEGFELRDLYEALEPRTDGGPRLPPPRGGELLVDGTPSRELPDDRAVLYQRTEGEAVVETLYLQPADPLPRYPGRQTRRNALLGGAAVTGVAAGALYVGAWAQRNQLAQLDPEATNADLERIQGTTNGLAAASIGAATAGAVQLALAVTVARVKR